MSGHGTKHLSLWELWKNLDYPSSYPVSSRNLKFYLGNTEPESLETTFLRLCWCEQSPPVPGSSWGCTEPSAPFAALPHLPWPGRQRSWLLSRNQSLQLPAALCRTFPLPGVSKAAPSWRAEEARPGQAGSAQAVPRLQTLLSSLNLQPWAEAKLVWMSLVIKVFYLSTPWQFVPVWCMRKGPSGAKPQIKCVLNEFKALNVDIS